MSIFSNPKQTVRISRTQKLSEIPALLSNINVQNKQKIDPLYSVFSSHLNQNSNLYTSYISKVNQPPPTLIKLKPTATVMSIKDDKDMITDKLRELLGHDREIENALKNETQARKDEVHQIIEKADEISESSDVDSVFVDDSEISSLCDFDELSLFDYEDYIDDKLEEQSQEEEIFELPNHEKADLVVDVIGKLIDAGRIQAFKKLFIIGVDEYDKW